MGEIVNLRRVKKQRARSELADQAAANRALHGRTRAEKASEMRAAARLKELLDQARIVTPQTE